MRVYSPIKNELGMCNAQVCGCITVTDSTQQSYIEYPCVDESV